MTGLDKILTQIKGDAKQEAEQILLSAQQEVREISDKARAEADRRRETLQKETAKKAADLESRSKSAAALQKRRALLVAKQQLIDEVLKEAQADLGKLPPEDYFKILVKMAAKYALPQEGELLLNAADRGRMPADFPEKVLEAARKNGGSLKVGDETRAITGGFILTYGGVEENCSFETLFDSEREAMQDRAGKLLFPGGN